MSYWKDKVVVVTGGSSGLGRGIAGACVAAGSRIVLAALGDDDSLPMLKDERIKHEHILNLEGHTVWLLHERLSYSMVASQQKQNGGSGVPDVVVFGHEHTTCLQNVDNTLYVNSGSPTFLHYKHGLGTVGILELNSGEPQASIIPL